mmetsp:Transcript_99176/g.251861  ORF Transcript_99176/g.251861 Transcript_99176/m.251861 type:complete len:621 (-) Transcript_99176:170-2032(-)
MATANGAEEQEEGGPLVFQRGKKLNEEYYIVSVRDNTEGACVKFSAYELETSETYDLSYSYNDFDALFKTHPELVNPSNKEGRYDWFVDRLDFTSEGSGGVKRLTLASEPTVEDETHESKAAISSPKTKSKDRLTYAERQRLRQEADKLEEKRAGSIAMKSEKNRKAFVAELQEKRKLEELKAQSRKQRIDEERAERREKAEMQKHINEERQKRYEENDKKREERIMALEGERRKRDIHAIQDLVEAANVKKADMAQKLENARARKKEEEMAMQADMVAKKKFETKIDGKREGAITERRSRINQAEKEYLNLRERQIRSIEGEQLEKEARKQNYLREKAAQRASQLREKHERIEAWEHSEDVRTQNNMKKEHARNMLMLDHIESLRQQFSQEQAMATSRKQAALEQRKDREAKEADEAAAESKNKAQLDTKRQSNISGRESVRKDKNQDYCIKIRDMKTAQALRTREQADQLEDAREKTRNEKQREREFRTEQDYAAAQVDAQREENIRNKELERDRKFASQIKERKAQETQQGIELEARKHQRRQQDKESAQKHEQEDQQRKRQMAILEDQREQMIKQRASERNLREKERLQSNSKNGTDGQTAEAADAAAASTAEASK